MIETTALGIVAMAGAYFVALGVGSLIVPRRVASFLLGFAGSARLHYIELLARVAVGTAFVASAHRLFASPVFTAAGWVLLVTSAWLLLVPWQWHHRFASRAVPAATHYIVLIGLASLAMGVSILVAVARGVAN